MDQVQIRPVVIFLRLFTSALREGCVIVFTFKHLDKLTVLDSMIQVAVHFRGALVRPHYDNFGKVDLAHISHLNR